MILPSVVLRASFKESKTRPAKPVKFCLAFNLHYLKNGKFIKTTVTFATPEVVVIIVIVMMHLCSDEYPLWPVPSGAVYRFKTYSS